MPRSEYQATNVLRKLYANTPDSDQLQRAAIFHAVGRADDNKKDRDAVYSQISVVFLHGFITKDYNPKNHELRGIKLTPKGVQALRGGIWDEIKKVVPLPSILPVPKETYSGEKAGIEELVTLELVTEITDAFNAQSRHWEWKLVRKEEPMEQAH